MENPQFKINKFLLLGKRKNYDLPKFKPGLNIIHGSTDTGKSMILRLISYCLGKYELSKRAPEIDEACTHIVLEVTINGKIITIKRDIHKRTKPIEIFNGEINNIKNEPDKLFHISGTQKFSSISSFLLDKLNIPTLKVPYAPNNPNKGYNTVSIKDILNLVYLNDGEIGHDNFFGKSNPNKYIKYVESLKALLKIESSEIQELRDKRNEKNKHKNELKDYINEVKKFLLEHNIIDKVEINQNIDKVGKELKSIELSIKQINKQIKDDSFVSSDIINEILSKKEELFNIVENMQITKIKVKEFKELLKSYETDLEKKQSLLEIQDLVENEPKTCPLCNSLIEGESDVNREYIVSETTELKHKINDLKEIISENEELLNSMTRNYHKEEIIIRGLEQKNSQTFKTYLSPLFDKRDKALIELGRKQEIINRLNDKKKMFIDYEEKLNLFNKIKKEVAELDLKLEKLKINVKSKEKVIAKLTNYFSEFIKFIKQPNAINPVINKNFIPYITIQDQDLNYYKVPGTAKKVILSIAYYTAILKYGLENESYLPNILLIDGPSTGRGTNPDDPTEEFDIKVFNAMFLYWSKIINNIKSKPAQIIIVDKTMPPTSVKKDILITFDEAGKNGLRKGLIDDI